jgi:predicted nucleotidyltransferase
MPDNIKGILTELKEGLVKIYGSRLKGVILFGSYARGEAHPPDSDIDVMIVLKGEFDYWEMNRLVSGFVADLSLKHDVAISRKFASDLDYANSNMPLFINVRREGVPV